MIDDDDSYQIDAFGNRVLIGLSVEETVEFLQLDERISARAALSHVSGDAWYPPEDHRWLELYEKHETARSPFLKSSDTRH